MNIKLCYVLGIAVVLLVIWSPAVSATPIEATNLLTGKVCSIDGTARAESPDGEVRDIAVGDDVVFGDTFPRAGHTNR